MLSGSDSSSYLDNASGSRNSSVATSSLIDIDQDDDGILRTVDGLGATNETTTFDWGSSADGTSTGSSSEQRADADGDGTLAEDERRTTVSLTSLDSSSYDEFDSLNPAGALLADETTLSAIDAVSSSASHTDDSSSNAVHLVTTGTPLPGSTPPDPAQPGGTTYDFSTTGPTTADITLTDSVSFTIDQASDNSTTFTIGNPTPPVGSPPEFSLLDKQQQTVSLASAGTEAASFASNEASLTDTLDDAHGNFVINGGGSAAYVGGESYDLDLQITAGFSDSVTTTVQTVDRQVVVNNSTRENLSNSGFHMEMLVTSANNGAGETRTTITADGSHTADNTIDSNLSFITVSGGSTSQQ